WMEKISEFNFSIGYIPGAKNVLADALSCIYSNDQPGTVHPPSEYVAFDSSVCKMIYLPLIPSQFRCWWTSKRWHTLLFMQLYLPWICSCDVSTNLRLRAPPLCFPPHWNQLRRSNVTQTQFLCTVNGQW
ncbi:hypothetical protein C8Q74DRAFT_1212165, partial [Fomes fomentarius]